MKEAGRILPFVLIIFWLHHVACRTIVPPLGTEPMPPVLEQGLLAPDHQESPSLCSLHTGPSGFTFFFWGGGGTFYLSPFDRDLGFPGSSAGKESGCNAGNLGLSPRLGRSPGEGNSYLL